MNININQIINTDKLNYKTIRQKEKYESTFIKKGKGDITHVILSLEKYKEISSLIKLLINDDVIDSITLSSSQKKILSEFYQNT